MVRHPTKPASASIFQETWRSFLPLRAFRVKLQIMNGENNRMFLRRWLVLSTAVLMLGLCPLMAATITYTISGTCGPVLSGSDPLGANGESGVVTAVVGTTLAPTTKTKTS